MYTGMPYRLIVTYLNRLGRCSRTNEIQLADDELRWRRDPLSHPDIRRMTKREVSDLYIDPSLLDDK